MIELAHFQVMSAALFAIGLYGVSCDYVQTDPGHRKHEDIFGQKYRFIEVFSAIISITHLF